MPADIDRVLVIAKPFQPSTLWARVELRVELSALPYNSGRIPSLVQLLRPHRGYSALKLGSSHSHLSKFFCPTVCPMFDTRGRIFGHVQPFYERAVSDLNKSMHRSLWV